MIRFDCGGSGSSGNCYSLTDENGKILLLDAGIPLPEIKKLVNWKVSNVSGAFISHCHKDHSLSAVKLSKAGIPVFEPYKGGRQSFRKDGWHLGAFELPHDDAENRGVYIKCPDGHRMLYMTDFSYCAYTFPRMNLNTILIECNYSGIDEETETSKKNHVYRGHCSLDTCCEFLRVNQTDALRTLILCHLSESNADAKEMVYRVKEIVGENVNVYVAGKGVGIDL